MFAAEITIITEGGRYACEYRALFFDSATGQFYGGSGPTALEALAWCMDEYIGRVVHGFGVRPARNTYETPGSRFPKDAPPTTNAKPRKRGKKAA